MTVGLKFLLWKNRNFWFQKKSIQICIFNCNVLFCETVAMGKGACIKKMVAVGNHSKTLMEKTNMGKGMGEG